MIYLGIMPTTRISIQLTQTDRGQLQSIVRAGSTPQKVARRARAILLAVQGCTNAEIAAAVGVSRQAVIDIRRRFSRGGIASVLRDAPRPGRKPSISAAKIDEVVNRTLHTKPRGATHWSTRSMAQVTGLSNATVCRIWQAYGLRPHLTETFKLSTDPDFVEKLRDVVGLYLDPPQHAMVLCVDEKSQIQALDRTQPILPLRPGFVARHTHDYIRHGTATLFAALSVADGKVIGSVKKRHRHQEFIAFLEEIDRKTPRKMELHIVLDNYGTHTHRAVYQWLARHPRFHFHFTPTSSSWLNQVERWFAELTEKRIRRGTFRSLRALIQALRMWLRQYNDDPKPFHWTATPKLILAKIAHSQEALVTGH
jgi:transposase